MPCPALINRRDPLTPAERDTSPGADSQCDPLGFQGDLSFCVRARVALILEAASAWWFLRSGLEELRQPRFAPIIHADA